MENENKNDRRNFLKTAGAALVAASVPAAVAAQSNRERPGSGNNPRRISVFSGVSEPNPNLPGTYGRGSYQLFLDSSLSESRGFAVLSDPVFMEINSQIRIDFAARTGNDTYLFRGTVVASRNAQMNRKTVLIQLHDTGADTCDVSLTIEDTPLAGLLLPAIQKIR